MDRGLSFEHAEQSVQAVKENMRGLSHDELLELAYSVSQLKLKEAA